jgi:hypothetical protein
MRDIKPPIQKWHLPIASEQTTGDGLRVLNSIRAIYQAKEQVSPHLPKQTLKVIRVAKYLLCIFVASNKAKPNARVKNHHILTFKTYFWTQGNQRCLI